MVISEVFMSNILEEVYEEAYKTYLDCVCVLLTLDSQVTSALTCIATPRLLSRLFSGSFGRIALTFV